jgi:hypothetical protein
MRPIVRSLAFQQSRICLHLGSTFQRSVARRDNFRSSKRIRERTKRMSIQVLCTFTPEVTLAFHVPGFQRKHNERLAPFFWNPLAQLTLTPPSLVPRSIRFAHAPLPRSLTFTLLIHYVHSMIATLRFTQYVTLTLHYHAPYAPLRS